MFRSPCVTCPHRFYRAALLSPLFLSSSPTSSGPRVEVTCDGKRCVARSSSTVTVAPCGGKCRRPPPPLTTGRTVAAVAAAGMGAATAAAAEFGARQRRKTGGDDNGRLLNGFAGTEGWRREEDGRGGGGGGSGGGSRRNAPPPMFGRNVPALGGSTAAATASAERAIHSETGGGAKDELSRLDPTDDDCPICRKYSRGPCGSLFTSWLKCADAHPGKDATTGEEMHLVKCMEYAEPLARCLEVNAEMYDGPLHEEETTGGGGGGGGGGRWEDGSDGRELRRAWSGVVDELEGQEQQERRRRTSSFPDSIRPEMEVRLGGPRATASTAETTTGEGIAAFSPTDHRGDKNLVLAYVKDQDGELLGAGSAQDVRDAGGFVRFGVGKGTRSVTACALYEGEDDNDDRTPIYTRTEVLPPREEEEGEK